MEGGTPEQVSCIEVPVERKNGTTVTTVPAALLGEARASDQRGPELDGRPPFTLAGEIFESSGHADLIRIFLPFGFDVRGRATGVLEVGYHRSFDRRPDWGQVEALRAAAAPNQPWPSSSSRAIWQTEASTRRTRFRATSRRVCSRSMEEAIALLTSALSSTCSA